MLTPVFCYEHVVRDDEIDALGHVNNLHYLKWMQSAAVAHSADRGWPTERYLAIGAGWVVRSHRIRYNSPAFALDQIIVRTWIADFRKVTSLRQYEIVRAADQRRLATAETNWVFIDFESRAPRRVPPEVLTAFATQGDQESRGDCSE